MANKIPFNLKSTLKFKQVNGLLIFYIYSYMYYKAIFISEYTEFHFNVYGVLLDLLT